MAFRNRSAQAPAPEDPEQLYRTLAGRDGAPPALWIHQGDVLRAWHSEHVDSPDVAIELPTGAGKTLVGGLIAEWRRRSKEERVAYLAPTNQLAKQTAARLSSYGISTVLLTGKSRDWNPADRASFDAARAVAVSVYSHVFNSNPALNAEVLLLDDAHAAESYVAGPWSIRIQRSDNAYMDVLAVIANALDPLVYAQLRTSSDGTMPSSYVHLASPTGIAEVAGDLEDVLRIAARTGGYSTEAQFAYRSVEGHVDRCLLYASYNSLLIRPLIPPTGAHEAFERARQRIYMSATLGSGGELERAFGRPSIERVPVPRGWDKQGTGRRFFCFPELTSDLGSDRASGDTWIVDTIDRIGKAVVLTPDGRTAAVFKERRVPPGMPDFEARDVEDDLDIFSDRSKGVLILTNRYDGIDLPDDACRLVILQGLPAKGDLQERFLYGSLGATEVLQERLRARFVQGAGRATRNAGDYAVVIVAGSELIPFCTRSETKAAMHPEVQAELGFGFDESLNIQSDEMSENIDAFLAQDDDWREAEDGIKSRRDRLERRDPDGTSELERAAPHEVRAWLAAWQGEWDRAVEQARAAIDALRGGRQVQRYAALWNYLAASWAVRLSQQTGDATWLDTSNEYLRAARAAGRGTTWLSRLAAPADVARLRSLESEPQPLDETAAAAIVSCFRSVARPSRFDDEVAAAQSALSGSSAGPFEQGLVFLGKLAGASTAEGNGGATAAPDATWRFGQDLWVCWEAKSEAAPTSELGADDVRQASGHLLYAASSAGGAAPSGSFTLVVTPQERIHPAARMVADSNVYRIRPEAARSLLDGLVRAWRALRSRSASDPDMGTVLSALAAERVLPTQWTADLTTDPLQAPE